MKFKITNKAEILAKLDTAVRRDAKEYAEHFTKYNGVLSKWIGSANVDGYYAESELMDIMLDAVHESMKRKDFAKKNPYLAMSIVEDFQDYTNQACDVYGGDYPEDWYELVFLPISDEYDYTTPVLEAIRKELH